MPPATRQDLERRTSSSNKTFTIIFVIVIVFVAFICLFWGYLLPKWQKRHPGRPSSTRFNGLGSWAAKYGNGRPASVVPSVRSANSHNQLSPLNNVKGPPRRFPAHPAVMARSDKVPPRPPAAVMVYNPRIETPFPKSPHATEPVTIPGITPRPSISTGNLRSPDISQGPFSPTPKEKNPLQDGTGKMGVATEMTEYFKGAGFGDAKDYILAVPEPLALKPRGAGRPPPLTKQLEKFPIPQSSSYGSGDEMHPKKLFANLEQTSRKDSTSDATHTTKSERARENILSDISTESSSIFARDKLDRDSPKKKRLVQKKSLKLARGEFLTMSTSQIHRAGTITRPRTPVAEYCELYERAAAEARSQPFRSVSLKRELTPSTEPLTESPAPISTIRSASTPPTSTKFPDKHLPMLPSPLRLKRDDSHLFKTPTPEILRGRISCTPSSAALPESPDKLGPLRNAVPSKRPHRKSIGFYHRSGKPRPVGLNLKDSFRALSPQKLVNRTSRVATADMLSPSMATHSAGARMSVGQGSSRYSRDTKGISIVRTPVTTGFPTPTRSEFLVLQRPKEAPRPKSIDLIRSKIDDWNLHTGDINLDPNNHAPTLKHMRTHSDLGPQSPSLTGGSEGFHLEGSSIADITDTPSSSKLPVPNIRVGSGSDDIFNDEHEASDERPPTRGKERLRAEQSAFSTWTTSDSNLSSMLGKVTPGHVEWI